MENVTADQGDALERLRARDPQLVAEWDEARGVAARVRGRLDQVEGEGEQALPGVESFFEEFGSLFGPDDFQRDVRFRRALVDELGWTHLEFQQQFTFRSEGERQPRDLEVAGARVAVHIRDDGTLTEVQSSCWREIEVETTPRVDQNELREKLTQAASEAPGFQHLQRIMQEQKEEAFPLMQEPRLVVHPWQGGFRLAWMVYAYAPVETTDPAGRPTGGTELAFGQAVMDAVSGEQLMFAPTRKHAETPDTGSGLAVTPLGGPFTSRSLNIVRVDTTSTYRLRDTTHAREIITFDADCNSSWIYPNIASFLNSGSIPVSEDTDGDKNWNRTPTDTTTAQRQQGQQPEVDIHHLCREAYEWYDALAGGRSGWDNGQYDAALVPAQPVRGLAHVRDGTNCRSINAFFDKQLVSGKWLAYLAFFDGDPTATCATTADRGWDYLAGSKFVVGHEYQHAITDFSFEDASGNPGLTYSGWFAAVHEGLSDVFGGLFSEVWTPGPEFSTVGMIFRNLVFPRDTTSWVNRPTPFPCGLSNNNLDHFADRNVSTFRYDRGTIIAHCAYLMGAGGVHERGTRTPRLIPVQSLGRQTVGGKDVLRAARIWYRAVAFYFSTHGALTGIPANDENTFRTLRNGCVSAAEDIYGTGSREHRDTILAFYSVGLHPAGTTYGADVTFMPWGWAWRLSRPYVGLSSPDWSSVDLFINNGGTSEWNAQINVLDSMGDPTQFENTVYCRVRNVGDQAASSVTVQFFYAKAGTGPATWLPVTDKDGAVQTLNVGTLAAGQSNFPDSAQNSPPAGASVKWYIPPLAAGETVDHFCLKAQVTASNDVNPHNNEVQSNISYVAYVPTGFAGAFLAGNPTEEEIPVDLRMVTALPEGWRAQLEEEPGLRLGPGETAAFRVLIDMPAGSDAQVQPPFDGDVTGDLYGHLSGPFTGTLTDTRSESGRLTGRFTGVLGDIGLIQGAFDGTVNVLTAEISGAVTGAFRCDGGGRTVCVGVRGCLRPWRRIDVGQFLGEEAIGGVTLQVQVPLPAGRCRRRVPTTATRVGPNGLPEKEAEPEESEEEPTPEECRDAAERLLECLKLPAGDVKSVNVRRVSLDVNLADDC